MAGSLDRGLVALVAAAAWSVVPPYLGAALGGELAVEDRVEIVDHVIPGVVAVVAALVALRAGRASGTGIAALAVCAVAGAFSAATHVTLVLDAGTPGRPWGVVLLHATGGVLLFAVALWNLLREEPA